MHIEPIKYNKQKRSVFSEDDEIETDNESNVNASQPIKYEPRDLKALERCLNLSEKISRFEISKAGFVVSISVEFIVCLSHV